MGARSWGESQVTQNISIKLLITFGFGILPAEPFNPISQDKYQHTNSACSVPASVPTSFVAAVSLIISHLRQQIVLLGQRQCNRRPVFRILPNLRNMIPAEQLAMSSRGSPSTP